MKNRGILTLNSNAFSTTITPNTNTNTNNKGTITHDYEALQYRTDLLLKIKAKLSEFFKRDIMLTWGAKGLQVNLVRQDHFNDAYSITDEASGLVHIVSLLSSLYNDEIGVLLIDEPELSLHPQYQSFLLDELRKVAGFPSEGSNKKLIIMATHSPDFVDLLAENDFTSLCFCEDLIEDPRQILTLKPINTGFIQRIGYQYKKALFAKKIILLEGSTEELICSALARQWNISLEIKGRKLSPLTQKMTLSLPTIFLRR